MTAQTRKPGDDWSLPHRKYARRAPALTSEQECNEWAIEAAIALFINSDDEDAFDLIRYAIRRDLTISQIWEKVDLLCSLSVEADRLEHAFGSKVEAWEAAKDDYCGELASFAYLPLASVPS